MGSVRSFTRSEEGMCVSPLGMDSETWPPSAKIRIGPPSIPRLIRADLCAPSLTRLHTRFRHVYAPPLSLSSNMGCRCTLSALLDRCKRRPALHKPSPHRDATEVQYFMLCLSYPTPVEQATLAEHKCEQAKEWIPLFAHLSVDKSLFCALDLSKRAPSARTAGLGRNHAWLKIWLDLHNSRRAHVRNN